jgi:hypothetical protein
MICKRQATIFASAPGDSDTRLACCDECLTALDVVLDDWGGKEAMDVNLTAMERKAIQDSRVPVCQAMMAKGIIVPDTLTEAQFDEVLEAAWNALRASMQMQTAKGEIPF